MNHLVWIIGGIAIIEIGYLWDLPKSEPPFPSLIYYTFGLIILIIGVLNLIIPLKQISSRFSIKVNQ